MLSSGQTINLFVPNDLLGLWAMLLEIQQIGDIGNQAGFISIFLLLYAMEPEQADE